MAGVRLRRKVNATGRDLTAQNVFGSYIFGWSGDVFTENSHSHVYEAKTGRRLAVVTRTILSVHTIYEVATYIPVCAAQAKQPEQDDGVPLYAFARLTKAIASARTSWALERYECDGNMTEILDINTRSMLSWRYNYDLAEPTGQKPIATIDQTYLLSKPSYYNMWITAGVDQALLVVVGMVMNIEHLQAKEQKNSTENATAAPAI